MSCNCTQEERIRSIKLRLQNKYPSLTESDCDTAFDLALAHYLVKKYPSQNNRPTPDEVNLDFVTLQTIYKIMDYLSGASGLPIGVKTYWENGMRFEFDTTTLSNYLDVGLPMAGVPK